jgi:uncharacterized phage protein (TIGR01671 family)
MNNEEIKNTIGKIGKREIEFRAFSIKNNRMLQNIPIGTIYIWGNGFEEKSENCIFMQFTGLTDKNGEKIFEGDIVNGEEPSVVLYGNYHCDFDDIDGYGYHILSKSGISISFSRVILDCAEEVEIIGNIFQNPELLI